MHEGEPISRGEEIVFALWLIAGMLVYFNALLYLASWLGWI